MALDNFRRTDVILDVATQKVDIETALKATEGEYKGRNLRIQLTNAGVIEAQNVNVYFGYLNPLDKEQCGMVQMDVVDASQGLYEVYYPTGMLTVEGIMTCQVKIVDAADEGHTIILSDFNVEIERSIFTNELEVKQDSIKLMDKIVLDMMIQERRITVMETNFADMYELMTLNIPNLDVAVSTRVSQESFNTFATTVTNYLSELKVLADDIYNGNTVSDWVNDLVNKGKSAPTYSNAERMTTLISKKECCLNTKISSLLIDYSLEKNQPIGTIFKNILGNGYSYTFDSIVSAADLVNNISLFTDITNNYNAFNIFLLNSQLKRAMFNKGSELYPALSTGDITKSVLNEKSTNYEIKYKTATVKGDMLMMDADVYCKYSGVGNITGYLQNASIALNVSTDSMYTGDRKTVPIWQFCNYAIWTSSRGDYTINAKVMFI